MARLKGAMTRFFFDIRDAEHLGRDKEGTALPSPAAARREALVTPPEMVWDRVPDADHHAVTADARDEAGRATCMAALSLTLRWFEPI